ncbi:isopropylmalate isomerase [Afipia sp. P52-10]|uniref:3-isopropylmalate dehydratase small subunit n=1 Tax=Afipia sp. P52-10 TaxID=1429916 RepID=UPI0003DF3B4D|nr:3-isopropylmalate dehydratase small subunit [Afipia sp. P52-10]ETR78701.1 isopropylmalate isomerase [Afipia sp. P52-10]
MQAFTVLTGVAAPLVVPNINTDVIIRIERLIGADRDHLGPYCFEALRYRPDGTENPDFVLNRPPWRGAPIILAGANFGCGSSREGAVWALMGLGVRCIIAPSFGEIFFNNCFQNGLLPIVLLEADVQRMASEAEAAPDGGAIHVDLVRKIVASPAKCETAFAIDDRRQRALLEGLDEIGQTRLHSNEIVAWQDADRRSRPWIWFRAS